MAEFEAIEVDGLSGPASSNRESTNPSLFAISLDPGARSSRRALEWLVFAGSLTLHVALYLKVHNNVTPQVTRFVSSQVDIELAPPVIEEPKVKEPDPPPEPAAASRQADPARPKPGPGRPSAGGPARQQQLAVER